MTFRITDLGDLAAKKLAVDSPSTEDIAKAQVLARLAAAQQQKVANIIAYLNSDTSLWTEDDEMVVRMYLGLTPGVVEEAEDGSGG